MDLQSTVRKKTQHLQIGGLFGIRTQDSHIKSMILYPTELTDHMAGCKGIEPLSKVLETLMFAVTPTTYKKNRMPSLL